MRLSRTVLGVALAAALPWMTPSLAASTDNNRAYVPTQPDASNMKLVGFHDLQGRSAYQPIAEQQGNRWIAYVGHHGGSALNPLTGQVESNGTSIVDVTDPSHPVYLHHIPGPAGAGEAGGAQMVRMCPGQTGVLGQTGKFYLLRTKGTQGHEVYDVTNPANPVLLSTPVDGQTDTHKSWWECDSGIAYLVGARPGWRTSRMTQIYDLSDPAHPKFIRNFGLPTQQPGSTGPVEVQLHGPYQLGNRVYFGYGTSSNGILQIVDRDKLLNDPSLTPATREAPTVTQLLYPQIARYDQGPTNGAHTVFPIMNMTIPSFKGYTKGATRNIIALTNESTGNQCRENPQMTYFVDITTETEPFGVGSFHLDPASGGQVNFCDRGGRFGTHSSDERINPMYYGKVLWLAYFNAGIRALDIRDPWNPKEIAYYIPAITSKTDQRCVTDNGVDTCKVAIQTNNLDSDNRGYVYAVDRANTGMHIVQLWGPALDILK
ncbi:MAG TPA: hypothetical protein VFE23_15430 [Usitatibacter sp.]|jgi:hypothetical protein|nr:hypothetical protein [Usitatibacter sp.]